MSEFTHREKLEIEKEAYERVLNTLSNKYSELLEIETPSKSELETREYLAERVNFLFKHWMDLHTSLSKLPPIIDTSLPTLFKKD